jgi:hypothetical protein
MSSSSKRNCKDNNKVLNPITKRCVKKCKVGHTRNATFKCRRNVAYKKLTSEDYKRILEVYNLPVPPKLAERRLQAKNVLSAKFCRCIKKVDPNNEGRAIGICTNTIFNKKGLTRGKFTCKSPQKLEIYSNVSPSSR